MTARDVLVRSDPTAPGRWARARSLGRTRFVLERGVLLVGLPVACIVHVLTMWGRGDADILFSYRSALALGVPVLFVAPLVGAWIGDLVWARGERRFAARESASPTAAPPDAMGPIAAIPTLTDADLPDPLRVAAEAELASDPEQATLTALAEQLDALRERDPRALRRRAYRMAALGYAYVVGIILAYAALVLYFAIGKDPFARFGSRFIVWITLYGLSIVLLLAVRFSAPKGVELTRRGAPALFAMIEDVARRVGAPVPHTVVIDADMNAAVAEVPRLGNLGRPRRYLVIGLPMLDVLAPDELRAVIAHEMGHLSGKHTRSLLWFTRLAFTFNSLAASWSHSFSPARPVFLPFVRWYSRRLTIYSQALARGHELESDAVASRVGGGDAHARALLRFTLGEHLLRLRLLPSVFAESARTEALPTGVFAYFARALRDVVATTDAKRWMRAALEKQSVDRESHPSIGQRVAVLSAGPSGGPADAHAWLERLAATAAHPAASEFFSTAQLERTRGRVEEQWRESVTPEWRKLVADAQTAARLEDAVAPAERDEAELARARWTAACRPGAEAIQLLRDYVRRVPTNAEAQLLLGKALLDSESETDVADGVAALERAARRSSSHAMLAAIELERYYKRVERRADADRARWRSTVLLESVIGSLMERRSLKAHDRLLPYALPTALREDLRHACAPLPIERAYVARKVTKRLLDQPLVVVGVVCERAWYVSDTGRGAIETCQRLLSRMTLPGGADLLVVPLEHGGALERIFRGIPGALSYERDARRPPDGLARRPA